MDKLSRVSCMLGFLHVRSLVSKIIFVLMYYNENKVSCVLK